MLDVDAEGRGEEEPPEERLEVLTLRWGAREEGKGRWKDLPELELVDQAWASRAGDLTELWRNESLGGW